MYNVVLVGDEYLVRKALGMIVGGSAEFQVAGEAESGTQAVQMADELSPDLIFMDVMMHGMNGLEASEIIKRRNPRVTIAIISAYNEFEYVRRAMRADVRHYLLKPFSVAAVKDVLNEYQEEHGFHSEAVDQFVSGLITRGFEASYLMLHSVIRQIFADHAQLADRRLALERLLSRLLLLIQGLDRQRERHYRQLFRIEERTCYDPDQAEFWLFDVVDEVFRQKSIRAYAQLAVVFSYIDSHLGRDIGLYQTAQHASTSESYLSRLFKRETGTHFAAYVNLKKINRSKRMLRQSRISISDVAFELGYNETTYFCKVFKRFERLTPGQYRENRQSGS